MQHPTTDHIDNAPWSTSDTTPDTTPDTTATAVADAPADVEPIPSDPSGFTPREPTAADIMPAYATWISAHLAETYLGIPADAFNAALKVRAFGISQAVDVNHAPTVPRADFLRWVEREQIQLNIPSSLRQRFIDRQRDQWLIDNPPPPPAARTVAELAARRAAEQAADAAADAAQQLTDAWREYRRLLERSGPPTERDAADLLQVCADLGIDPSHFSDDQRLLDAARKHQQDHDAREEAKEAIKTARQEERELLERHKAEAEAMARKRSAAHFRSEVCNRAAHELDLLRRRRPQFFDATAYPPRLLEVPADA